MKAEWLLIIVPVLILLTWAIWYNLTNKWYNWRYKPENDKARPGKGPNGPAEPEDSRIRKPVANLSTPARSNDRIQLEAPSPIKIRPNSKSSRGFFATRRRK